MTEVKCNLCLLKYKAFEVDHLVPYKMLVTYKNHTWFTSRYNLDLKHIRVKNADFLSHSLRVCKICYALILQEYELYLTGMSLGRILNIPIQEINVMSRLKF